MKPGLAMLISGRGDVGPTDLYWANVSSLLHFDGADESTTFTDDTGKAWTPSGNAQLDTSKSKFGGSSAYFDGGGDYIETPFSSAFAIGLGDFTVEFFICPNNVSSGQVVFEMRHAAGAASGLVVTQPGAAANKLRFAAGDGSGSYEVDISSTSTISSGTFVHFAATRSGNNFRMFLDGVQQGPTVSSAFELYLTSNPRIGADRAGGVGFNGWIDEFRFTKGVARYTSNFTPPAAKFPSTPPLSG